VSTTDEIVVWRRRLDVPDDLLVNRLDWLSADERARAGQFRSEVARHRFIAARTFLREVLSRHLGIHPAEVAFTYGEHGKPSLKAPLTGALHFNLSRTRRMVVCAVSRTRQLGVDIESLESRIPVDHVARDYFSLAEISALGMYSGQARVRAFFACWTRKEAVLKATGCGLSRRLDSFSVTVAPDDEPRIVESTWADDRRWSLANLTAAPDHEAALAVDGVGWTVSYIDA
jgi:4'-phosphopantetheinyl transferase